MVYLIISQMLHVWIIYPYFVKKMVTFKGKWLGKYAPSHGAFGFGLLQGPIQAFQEGCAGNPTQGAGPGREWVRNDGRGCRCVPL